MSKEQIISLEEAFEKGIVKVGDYVDYRPTYGEYRPTKNLTGSRYYSIFKTENFGWKLDNIDGKKLLIADGVTGKALRLYGKTGYKHGTKALNNIARVCYTDPMLTNGAISMTEHVYKSLALCNVLSNLQAYWLGSTYVGPNTTYTTQRYFGLCVVDSGFVCGGGLFHSSGDECSGSYRVRSAAPLKPNIKLVLSEESDGSKARPWQPLREEACLVSDTATQNKEEAEPMSEENSFKANDSEKVQKESLKDLLQQSEKIAVESMESLRQLNEMIQTIKEILNS